MIHANVAQKAIDLAEQLDARRLQITVRPDSPIAALVASSGVYIAPSYYEGISPEELKTCYQPTGADVEAETTALTPSADQVMRNDHDANYEKAVTVLADSLRSHESFARTVVTPAVVELHERVKASLDAIPNTVIFSPTIVQVDLPEPLQNATLKDEVLKYNGIVSHGYNHALSMKSRTGPEVIEMLKTGNDVLDTDISLWAVRKGEAFFANVWATVFTQDPAVTGNYATLVENNEDGGDAALAIFLLCTVIAENPDDTVKAPLDSWRAQVAELKDEAGLKLSQVIESMAVSVRAGRLIIKFDRNQIQVNKAVYRRYLENGGTDTEIIGSSLMDAPKMFEDNLMENRQACQDLWEMTCRSMTASQANRRVTIVKTLVRNKVQELLSESLATYFPHMVEQLGSQFSTTHPFAIEVLANVEKEIDAMEVGKEIDLWGICTDVMGKGVFHFSNAHELLTKVNEFSQVNPEVSVSENAALAQCEMLIDFMFDQLEISSF